MARHVLLSTKMNCENLDIALFLKQHQREMNWLHV